MGGGKLVRDKIPDIIRAEGLNPVIRVATQTLSEGQPWSYSRPNSGSIHRT